jgi:hypothetical protein
MRKIIIVFILSFIALNGYCDGFGYSGDGLGGHNAFKDLEMNEYAINVGTINGKDSRLHINENLKLNDALIVGDIPASIEATLVPGSAWFNRSVRIDGNAATRADRYSFALLCISNLAEGLIYTNPSPFTASFATGTAIITDTDAPFTSSMVGEFITIAFSGPTLYEGATGEIIEFLDASNIRIQFPANGNNEMTGISFMIYFIFEKPVMVVNDEGSHQFIVGDDERASFEIVISSGNSAFGVHIEDTAIASGHTSVEIDCDPNENSSVTALQINYDATCLGTGEENDVVNIIVDTVESDCGEIHAIDVFSTNNGTCAVTALVTNTNVNVIDQKIGTSADLGIGIQQVLGVYVDSTTAFNSSSINVPIFTNDNDEVILASKTKFDSANFILNTPASVTILPIFSYSTGGVLGFQTFSPEDDTNGMTQNGSVNWDSSLLTSPAWSTATVTEATGGGLTDSTTYYFMKIQRIRNLVVTTPIESTISLETITNDYIWDKDGNINLNTIAVTDGITAPDAISGQAIIYVDVSGGDLKIVFGDGTVKTIVTDD